MVGWLRRASAHDRAPYTVRNNMFGLFKKHPSQQPPSPSEDLVKALLDTASLIRQASRKDRFGQTMDSVVAIGSLLDALKTTYPHLVESDSPFPELLRLGGEDFPAAKEVRNYIFDQLRKSEGNDQLTVVVMLGLLRPNRTADLMARGPAG
jgi:hypothetical protein